MQKSLGANAPDKQNQNLDDRLLKMTGLKSINTARSSLDPKLSNRNLSMNYTSLPPLDHSRSTITIQKNSFISNIESGKKSQIDPINEYWWDPVFIEFDLGNAFFVTT